MRNKIMMFTDSDDSGCVEIEEYLKDLEINLCVHDTKDKPLSYGELSNLIGYFGLNHFIERSACNGRKIPVEIPFSERDGIIEYIAEDNKLLRKPIIISGRLMSVGKDRDVIQDLLQIKENGSDPDSEKKTQSKN
jgi:arsenate reductase-like glutaredoxin family protein